MRVAHRRPLVRAIAAPCCIALAACAEGERETPRSTVRDSAGVRMVESARPAWSEGERDGWTVAAEPRLSIGVTDGEGPLLLSGVVGAIRLDDGRIVVADGGSHELRFFDGEGRFLSATGGEGEGPGEFSFLGRLWRRPGDTLVATDISRRISVFDPQGRYVRAEQLVPSPTARRARALAQTHDGTFLAMSGTRGFGPPDAGRVIHDTLQLFRHAADGSYSGLLVRLPGQERWGLEARGVTSFPFLPFSAPSSWAAGGDRFYTGTGRAGEVAAWRPDGTLEQVVRWPAETRPVDDALLARYGEHRLEDASDPNERRRVAQFLADAPVAETVPAYQSLLVDDTGYLWVERYRPAWEREPVWEVFAPDGAWLGSVRTPSRVRVFQIGSDFLLGRWLDENDVQHVQLYPLLRPAQ